MSNSRCNKNGLVEGVELGEVEFRLVEGVELSLDWLRWWS